MARKGDSPRLANFVRPLLTCCSACSYQLSGRNLTIRGDCADNGGPCVLDASNKNRHFIVEQAAAEAVAFQDVVFANGTLNSLQTEYSVGGAVRCLLQNERNVPVEFVP